MVSVGAPAGKSRNPDRRNISLAVDLGMTDRAVKIGHPEWNGLAALALRAHFVRLSSRFALLGGTTDAGFVRAAL